MRLIDRVVELGLSRANAKKALQSGKVFVRGVPSSLAIREVEADEVEYRSNAPRLRPGRDLAVVHKGEGYLVVWKPAHLLSVPAPGRREETDLLAEVARRFGNALAVHRLDEQTSGLMLVALDEARQLALKEALAERLIARSYFALVSPALSADWSTTVDNELVRDRGDGRRGSGSGPDAKRAVSHFRIHAPVSGQVSLVEARLETGRTHQIRIHLSELGHPVIGDPLYGPRKSRFERLALHSHRLAFTDPAGHELSFEVGLPDDMQAFVQRGGMPRDRAPGRPPQGRKPKRKRR